MSDQFFWKFLLFSNDFMHKYMWIKFYSFIWGSKFHETCSIFVGWSVMFLPDLSTMANLRVSLDTRIQRSLCICNYEVLFSSCHLYFSLRGLDTFIPICVVHEMRFTKLKLWMGGIILGSYPSTWEWQNEGHPPDWGSLQFPSFQPVPWLLVTSCSVFHHVSKLNRANYSAIYSHPMMYDSLHKPC